MSLVRAFFRAIQIPDLPAPHNVAQLKIYYPAMLSDSPEERDTGVVPPDNDLAPFPTVILSSGVNLPPGKMSWLAAHLAADGYTVVTYRLVGEEMPGHVTLTPGFDLDALRPENLDSRPSGIAYGPIIEELKQLNRKGLLKGLIDVEHIIFGGHSAGGSAALMNASKKWFEGICAAFSYGAHTGVATILAHPPNSVVPISPDVPVLLLGGTRDGCISESAGRYGGQPNATTGRIIQTFEEGVRREKGDSAMVLIEGANHSTFAHPCDEITGRPFIDLEETCDGDAARSLLAKLILTFSNTQIAGRTNGFRDFTRLLDNPMIAVSRRK